jgi:hydrogenase maturation protease
MKRILIAGIGNNLLGDDAFGCEVVRKLAGRILPPDVFVNDFGIHGYDLAFALTEGYDTVIMVGAVPRGHLAGTVYSIEPNRDQLEKLIPPISDGYCLNPLSVLQLANSLGVFNGRLFLVGCEPLILGTEGQTRFSKPMRRAVPQAIKMIESLIRNCPAMITTTITTATTTTAGLAAV